MAERPFHGKDVFPTSRYLRDSELLLGAFEAPSNHLFCISKSLIPDPRWTCVISGRYSSLSMVYALFVHNRKLIL